MKQPLDQWWEELPFHKLARVAESLGVSTASICKPWADLDDATREMISHMLDTNTGFASGKAEQQLNRRDYECG